MSEAAARDLTEKIKAGIEATWQLVAEAYLKRADQALGYESWDHYIVAEFGSSPLRVPREDRPELIRSLRVKEMSLRAIATTLGVSERTVRRDLDDDTAANAAVPATVVGLDGRRQPARREPFWKNPGPSPDEPPQRFVIVDRRPQRPPAQRDHTVSFYFAARSLLWRAKDVAALHQRTKENPGPSFADGVAKVRQAAEILQRILADD
jgi:hypothetical protein